MARSLVITPYSTVYITLSSKISQNLYNSLLLSNLALCSNPLVHAKMLAIEFVEVSFPY